MSLNVYIDSKIGVKKKPSSLQDLCMSSVCQALLQHWKVNITYAYSSNTDLSLEYFLNELCAMIPAALYDQMFELMIDSHGRFIQNNSDDYFVPSISALLNTIISSKLKKLNLQCLRHMGVVADDEISYFHSILKEKLPNLSNLVEISLQTSGTDSTLPVCMDDVLKEIGQSCYKLTNLDISFNHTVTNNGLQYLIRSKLQRGCPKLVKLSLFECSVTHTGIVGLLQELPKLKFLGYKETGQCLRVLNNQENSSDSVTPLRLAHINNLGKINRTCKNLHKLECDDCLVNIISKFCPEVNALKVRVKDSSVKFLQRISNVSIIDLVYNLGKPSSPGNCTIQYLELNGTQFNSLSFLCDNFSFQHLAVISEQCFNLKHLTIRCNSFSIDKDITIADKKKCALTILEECIFRIGNPADDYQFSDVPFTVFEYVLHKSNILKEIGLVMKSSHVCDFNIEKLFSSIGVSNIKKVIISVPHKSVRHSLNLSTLTAVALIRLCPELIELGNLRTWEINTVEIVELRRQLYLSNSALVLIRD